MSFLGKTPLEAMLERENAQLRAEVDYLRRRTRGVQYSTMEEPEVLIKRVEPTLKLAVLGGVNHLVDELQWHVYAVDRTQKEHFKVGYYISDLALMEARDRAYVLQKLLADATRQLEKIL